MACHKLHSGNTWCNQWRLPQCTDVQPPENISSSKAILAHCITCAANRRNSRIEPCSRCFPMFAFQTSMDSHQFRLLALGLHCIAVDINSSKNYNYQYLDVFERNHRKTLYRISRFVGFCWWAREWTRKFVDLNQLPQCKLLEGNWASSCWSIVGLSLILSQNFLFVLWEQTFVGERANFRSE